MDHYLGLRSLLAAYLGLGSNDVHPGRREERKSVGSERFLQVLQALNYKANEQRNRTFHTVSSLPALLDKLENIAASLEADLERTGFAGRTITLKYKLDTFKCQSISTYGPDQC